MPLISEEQIEKIRAEYSEALDYVAVMEDIFHRERDLVEDIKKEFNDVVLGDGIGLFEGESRDMAVDQIVCLSARERDERGSWKDLSVDELCRNSSSLIFTDAKGFRFLIPAFMLVQLSDQGDDDYALRCLALARDPRDPRFSLLGLSQLQLIVEFLRIYYNYPLEVFPRNVIRQSIDSCWLHLIQLRSSDLEFRDGQNHHEKGPPPDLLT